MCPHWAVTGFSKVWRQMGHSSIPHSAAAATFTLMSLIPATSESYPPVAPEPAPLVTVGEWARSASSACGVPWPLRFSEPYENYYAKLISISQNFHLPFPVTLPVFMISEEPSSLRCCLTELHRPRSGGRYSPKNFSEFTNPYFVVATTFRASARSPPSSGSCWAGLSSVARNWVSP